MNTDRDLLAHAYVPYTFGSGRCGVGVRARTTCTARRIAFVNVSAYRPRPTTTTTICVPCTLGSGRSLRLWRQQLDPDDVGLRCVRERRQMMRGAVDIGRRQHVPFERHAEQGAAGVVLRPG